MRRALIFVIALLGSATLSCAEPPPELSPPLAVLDGSMALPDLALPDLALPDLALPDLASADLLPADLALAIDAPPPPDSTGCAVPPMTALYPGAGPPNPYGPLPAADSCIAVRHDVILVLGCPNQASGAPAPCQTKRADIAVALKVAGFGDRFITSGAAVHNSYVEAATLRDLLIARGIPAAHITTEEKARHTDENIYYSAKLMAAQGWRSALVVSDDPGHLILSAVCDSNCCVDLGRLTVLTLPVKLPGHSTPAQKAVGHYVLHPHAAPIALAECTFIQSPLKFMCTNLKTRLACAGRVMLP